MTHLSPIPFTAQESWPNTAGRSTWKNLEPARAAGRVVKVLCNDSHPVSITLFQDATNPMPRGMGANNSLYHVNLGPSEQSFVINDPKEFMASVCTLFQNTHKNPRVTTSGSLGNPDFSWSLSTFDEPT